MSKGEYGGYIVKIQNTKRSFRDKTPMFPPEILMVVGTRKGKKHVTVLLLT